MQWRNGGRFFITIAVGLVALAGIGLAAQVGGENGQTDQSSIPQAKGMPAIPLGLEPDMFVVPADNPITEKKVELGRLLFFDKRLSKNNTIACASCHMPALAF